MRKVYNDSVFSKNSITSLSRTLYKKSQDHKLTFDAGSLVPIFIDEVIPGDNFKIKYSSLIYALSPMKKPILDKLQVDVFSFFVPMRLLDRNFEKVYCNYKPNADYSSDVNLTLSTIQVPDQGFGLGGVADYLGVPPNLGVGKKISHLPFRGYVKIWDEWFRPQYLQSSIWNEEIPVSGNVVGTHSVTGDWETDAIVGGKLCPVAKTKDYFTTSLPFPQVGAGELLNIGGLAPVVGYLPIQSIRSSNVSGNSPYYLGGDLKLWSSDAAGNLQIDGGVASNYPMFNYTSPTSSSSSLDGTVSLGKYNYVGGDALLGNVDWSNLVGSSTDTAYSRAKISDANRLYADLSNATSISIREMRWLFQTQLVKEMDLFGNRLFEVLNVHFGVVASDSRYQRSEFLGHSRFFIGSYQVTQTSASSGDNAMGSLSSYMVGRTSNEFLLNKAFPEPGYIFILACVRISNHTYAEGCHRLFRKLSRFDFMWPAFTTVGDQETYSDEIYFGANKDDIFGYQTRYAEYKYLPDRVSGLMRPTSSGGQIGDIYAYTDYYGQQVYLSPDWIWEDKSNIDRTLAVSSSVSGAQFVAQFYFKVDNIRVTMSGQPGLVDHSHRSIW